MVIDYILKVGLLPGYAEEPEHVLELRMCLYIFSISKTESLNIFSFIRKL